MKSSVTLVLALATLGLAACSDSPTAPDQTAPAAAVSADGQSSLVQEFASPGNHIHVMPTKSKYLEGFARGGKKSQGGKGGGTGIFYHGGPIIYGPRVAAIYWSTSTIYDGGPAPGTTGSASGDGSLVGYFMSNLGSSDYWRINTTYTDGGSGSVGASLAYDGYWAANADPPSRTSDTAIQNQIVSAFTSGKLAFDPSTIYAVFTGPGINLGGGFGSQYCAYHGHFNWNGNDVKYAAMPYDYDFPSGCTVSQAPNGDAAADAEVNTLAHEVEEFATDPSLNAWYDHRGYENADKCAWKFGTTSGSSGQAYNITVGTRHFLVQQNWVNAGSGGCLLSWS